MDETCAQGVGGRHGRQPTFTRRAHGSFAVAEYVVETKLALRTLGFDTEAFTRAHGSFAVAEHVVETKLALRSLGVDEHEVTTAIESPVPTWVSAELSRRSVVPPPALE